MAAAAIVVTASNSSFDFAIADFDPASAAAFGCFGIGLDCQLFIRPSFGLDRLGIIATAVASSCFD